MSAMCYSGPIWVAPKKSAKQISKQYLNNISNVSFWVLPVQDIYVSSENNMKIKICVVVVYILSINQYKLYVRRINFGTNFRFHLLYTLTKFLKC